MKKYILSLLIAGSLPTTVSVVAQTKQQALDLLMKKKAVLEAKETIDKVTDGSGKSDAEAWFYRGMIYKSVYDDDALRQNNKEADLEAYKAYKKAIQMGDAEDDHLQQSREDMFELASGFASTATNYYEDGMKGEQLALKKSIEYFDAFIDIYNTVKVEQANIDKNLKDNELDFSKVKYMAAQAKERVKDIAGAEKYYQELVDTKFNEPALYLNLSNLYIADGKRDKAEKVLIDGGKRLPEATEISLAYAKLISDDKRYQEAIDIAQKAAKRDKNSGLPWATLGEIYEKMVDYPKAEEAFKKGIDVAPDDFEPTHNFGCYYYRRAEAKAKKNDESAKEDYLAAITFFESANRADPKNQDNLSKLYDCYLKTENQRKADQIKLRMR